jgi:pimeloyl-ACP methyl ester carboxylesterase
MNLAAKRRLWLALLGVGSFVLLAPTAPGQARRMTQDPKLDNLQHAPGTSTAPPGTLGRVRKVGTGPRSMVLIAGMGFGDSIWNEFMDRRLATHTMYAVTLPGFGGTAPLPMPVERARYAETAWIDSSVGALQELLVREDLRGVTVVAHWAVATQVALRLALAEPERVASVVLIAGALRATFPQQPASEQWTPEQRGQAMQVFADRWFKTVTRDTWDDNNYMPYDYAVNPRRGLFLWREAQAASVAVWVRYLLEYYAVDLRPRLPELRAPLLVVHPDFDDPGFYVEDPANNYMKDSTEGSWKGVAAVPNRLEFARVANSRLFVMYDKPDELDRVVDEFLARARR